MSSTVLDHGVARTQGRSGAVVQFENHLTGQHHLEIDGRSRVHPRRIRFHVLRKAWQFLFQFLQRGACVEGVVDRIADGGGWKREEPEAEAADGRKVAASHRHRAVVRESRRLVATPESMKLDTGQQRDADRSHQRVAHEHGLATRVMPCHNPAHVHGRLLGSRLGGSIKPRLACFVARRRTTSPARGASALRRTAGPDDRVLPPVLAVFEFPHAASIGSLIFPDFSALYGAIVRRDLIFTRYSNRLLVNHNFLASYGTSIRRVQGLVHFSFDAVITREFLAFYGVLLRFFGLQSLVLPRHAVTRSAEQSIQHCRQSHAGSGGEEQSALIRFERTSGTALSLGPDGPDRTCPIDRIAARCKGHFL